ncbi:MAG: Histidinol dehydrogenase [Methanophagales archaeon]|nr:histidinol dehydrogenase [Methanophagales archaeon]MCU4140340.1 Histidinol dehydrogenase [Methanophagales archaeon]
MRVRRARIRDLSDAEKAEMRGLSEIEAVFPAVREIVEAVKERGDAALVELTERFDGVKLQPSELEVSEAELEEAEASLDPALKKSIEFAAEAIRKFHFRQKSKSWFEDFGVGGVESERGVVRSGSKGSIILGEVFVPLERVGVYVPSGYFSTALMCVIPASVAGVREIAVCTPPQRKDGKISAAVLFAARLAGASRIFKVGGAQAIAALAFGTETIPKVQKIVGPGNVFVTAAKMLLRSERRTEIEFPAGPSEVLIIADASANPEFIAADMLAQAEHGTHSKAILLTDDERLANAVQKELELAEEQVERAERAEKAEKAEARGSAGARQFWILLGSMEECVEFANEYAPEHLEIVVREPFEVLRGVKNAGSVFLGAFSPVAAGDYATGANHVLPTAGFASLFSGLSVHDFMRRMTVQMLDAEGLRKIKDAVVQLARAEGMEMHARSVEVRFK